MQKTTRNASLDFTKGLVIFLMLWGHFIQYMIPSGLDFFENPVFKAIYGFHMPCFALISGYLLGKSLEGKDPHFVLGKRVCALIIPIVFAQFLNAFLCSLPNLILNFGFESFKELLMSMVSASSLWFFWSILASVIAIVIAKTMTNNLVFQLCFLALLVPLFLTFPNSNQNLFMYPYVVIGCYFFEIKKHIWNKHSQKYMLLGYATIPIYIFMMFFFEGKHYIYFSGMFPVYYPTVEMIKIDLFRYAVGLMGSIAFICLAFAVCKLFKNNFYFGIDLLGKKSLQIYALSCALLSFYLSKITYFIYQKAPSVEMFLYNHSFVFNFIVTFVIAILYCFVLYGCIRLLEKSKLSKYIYGR